MGVKDITASATFGVLNFWFGYKSQNLKMIISVLHFSLGTVFQEQKITTFLRFIEFLISFVRFYKHMHLLQSHITISWRIHPMVAQGGIPDGAP